MKQVRYLIIGGGMTAAAALSGIRSVDPDGSIALLSAEKHPPYNRPPLSKGLWQGTPLEKIWRKLPPEGVELLLGRRAVGIDPTRKEVRDNLGNEYRYDKLLIATGGSPRRLPFGGDEIVYFRTLDDYSRMQDLASRGGKFGVIGGGFIGSEIAAALQMNGHEAAMVFPEPGIGARLFPSDLSAYITDYYQEKGVDVLPGRMVHGIERQKDKYVIRTDRGEDIRVDHIVAGIGIVPNTSLAEQANIRVDDGIVVDETLQTSEEGIYAAGDVASFYNPSLGERIRVEHEENANRMGKIAGQNIAGERIPYHHLPSFYSDMFDMGYEAMGELNPEYDVVADWEEPYRKGVLYYLRKGQVRGVLLWNVWDQGKAARELIGKPYSVEVREEGG